ncbi:MAG: histidine phosphatase family protein [Bacillota bacterium]|nr:histidine phosphatase family protein [Bacillota bacterium]
MEETRLILVRHGETEWNRDAKIQGQLDVVLSAVGRAQAKRVAGRLAGEELAAVYSSDLARARETAAIIAEPHCLAVATRPDLREGCFGAWQGLTIAEVQERFAENYAAFRQDPVFGRPLDGECIAEVADRAQRAVEEIAAAHPGETVAVVTHGGALKAIVCRLLGLDLAQRRRFVVDNCSLTVFAWREGLPVLLTLNDTAHLGGELVADVEV